VHISDRASPQIQLQANMEMLYATDINPHRVLSFLVPGDLLAATCSNNNDSYIVLDLD